MTFWSTKRPFQTSPTLVKMRNPSHPRALAPWSHSVSLSSHALRGRRKRSCGVQSRSWSCPDSWPMGSNHCSQAFHLCQRCAEFGKSQGTLSNTGSRARERAYYWHLYLSLLCCLSVRTFVELYQHQMTSCRRKLWWFFHIGFAVRSQTRLFFAEHSKGSRHLTCPASAMILVTLAADFLSLCKTRYTALAWHSNLEETTWASSRLHGADEQSVGTCTPSVLTETLMFKGRLPSEWASIPFL